MAFDFSKLNGRIVEKFGTRTAFAEAAGFSKTQLSARLNNQVPFTAGEIHRISAPELLDIKDSDITAYFFTLEVR